MEHKTLYNLLRMNWLRDPSKVTVEPWQVADYRHMPLDELFQQLNQHDIPLDRHSFPVLAEEVDSPEDFTDRLIADMPVDAVAYDQIYLLIFELWRRLVPEKLCLSIFCDELDHLIDSYDRGELTDAEALQDVLANLEVMLEDNTEEVNDPQVVFDSISGRCANDLECFLYDFIADQLDNKDAAYASELLEDFSKYPKDVKWFDLLKARCIAFTDIPKANLLIQQLIRRYSGSPDVEFNMEMLSVLVKGGDRDLFFSLVKQTIPLLKTEEEFQDLLAISADYFHFLDEDQKENTLLNILEERSKVPLDSFLSNHNSQISQLTSLFR